MPDDQRSRGESRQDAGRAAGSTEHDAVPALARHVRPSTGRVTSCRRTTDRGETNRVAGPSVAGVRSGAAASPDALPPGSLAPCGRVDPGLRDACILVAQWGECGEPEALRRYGGFRGERTERHASTSPPGRIPSPCASRRRRKASSGQGGSQGDHRGDSPSPIPTPGVSSLGTNHASIAPPRLEHGCSTGGWR